MIRKKVIYIEVTDSAKEMELHNEILLRTSFFLMNRTNFYKLHRLGKPEARITCPTNTEPWSSV